MGKQDLEIAAEIGISNQKAARWRKRFLKMGLAGWMHLDLAVHQSSAHF